MNALKKILVQIARLPARDQRWILKQLSSTAQSTLSRWDGLALLKEAQRFRTLPPQDICISNEPAIVLPAYAQTLAMRAPLYAAIVIERGDYPWGFLFLKQFDKTGAIKRLLENQVFDIKTDVKEALFKAWEDSLSFEHHLEASHG